MSEQFQGESILVVDDDDNLRTRMARAFENRGFRAMPASCYSDVESVLQSERPDRAVIDLKMPGPTGLDVLRYLMDRSPATKAVILTGYGSITNAVDAIKIGAVNYVTKPANVDEVLAAFKKPGDEAGSHCEELHPQSLAEAEWDHIQRVLHDCDGNISEAARRLDIPRRTLQRKLKKLAP